MFLCMYECMYVFMGGAGGGVKKNDYLINKYF